MSWSGIKNLLLGALAAIGCSRTAPFPAGKMIGQPKVITAHTVATVEELTATLSANKVILHIDVDWAGTAIHSRPTVVELRESVERDVNLNDVIFRRIDCTTDSDVCRRLEDWLALKGDGLSRVHAGNGTLLWILDDQLKDAIGNAREEGIAALIDRTRAAFRD